MSRTAAGYESHAIVSGNPMPDAFAVTTLQRLREADGRTARVGGRGYLLGDAHHDACRLFDRCHAAGHHLACPRAEPGTGEGHHCVWPRRRRAIAMPGVPAAAGGFGRDPYRRRTAVERDFSQLACLGAGLGRLPAWVRRIRRVRQWATNKLWLMFRFCSVG